MLSTNIIFTGLVRNPDLFVRSIKDLIKLRREKIINKIIFSTWLGELDKYDGIRDMLNNYDCHIIESEQPPKSSGHVWHQMKALYSAMEFINEDSYCLKTRADLYINPEFIKKLICDKDYLKIDTQRGGNKIFEEKIWIPYFEITKPFYMSDECFFGKAIDINKLVNFDVSYDLIYNIDCGITHIRRFIHPFVNREPILKQYLKYAAYSGHFTPLRFPILKFNLDSKFYCSCLAIYYYIIKSYFRIEGDYSSDQFIFQRECLEPAVKINNNEFISNFKSEKSRNPKGGQIYSYNEKWLNNLFAKEIKNDFIYERLYTIYLQYINNRKIINNNIHEEGLEYKRSFELLLNDLNDNLKTEKKYPEIILRKLKNTIKRIMD